jgi:sporulation protein YlmC with PRC-barrel domain
MSEPVVLSASTMSGDKVKNPSGEKLGEIKELMIDIDDGRVAYAVLSSGGFLNVGDKLFAIPWEALDLDTGDHSFVLDVSKEKLEAAPGFDKDHWPDMADRTWGGDVHRHFGYRPYWEPAIRGRG